MPTNFHGENSFYCVGDAVGDAVGDGVADGAGCAACADGLSIVSTVVRKTL
jgi:hypothetical protein